MTRRARVSDRVSVAVYADSEALATAAAAAIAEEARRSVEARGRFAVALAGGATPRRAYELLAEPPLLGVVPWQGVQVFWTDERCVEGDDPRSNERMAREALLDRVPIPADRVHPIRCGAGQEERRSDDPRWARQSARRRADDYDALLRRLFQDRDHVGPGGLLHHAGAAGTALDLALLGVGTDGHTASLFPGTEVLHERRRWAAPVFVPAAAAAGTAAHAVADATAGTTAHAAADATGSTAADDAGLWRVTLTAPFIDMAASVLFMASGPAKAPVVAEVLEGPPDAGYLPARLVRPRAGEVRWFLDEAAAALLGK